MKIYKNITIIGTSHIAIESVKEVEFIIRREKPDLVALELDKNRFHALFAKKRSLSLRDIKRMGVKAFLFNLAGAFVEKKLGNLVGSKPGNEMKKAVELAREQDSKIALIDQDVNITLKRLSDKLTFKEKFNFFMDLLKSLFKKNEIKFDLHKVPSREIVKKLTDQVKKRYPSVYSVLVDERNKYMAKNLYRLMLHYDNIVAIVGAGHEEDIIKEVKIWESLMKKR